METRTDIKKIWVKKSTSFESSNEFDIDYYLSMSPSERIETVQLLREMACKFKKGLKNGKGRKGLRKVIKVVKRA